MSDSLIKHLLQKSSNEDNAQNNSSLHARHSDAPWFESLKENCDVLLIGMGNIGSWLSVYLGKAGVSPILTDFDIIEPHNLGGQLYSEHDLYRLKVQAAADNIRKYSLGQASARVFEEMITSSYGLANIIENFPITELRSEKTLVIMTGVDNMTAREDIYSALLEFSNIAKYKNIILIDGRSSPEQYEVYFADIKSEESKKKYEQYLYDDSEIQDAPCSYKSTAFCGAQVASMMMSVLVNYLTNKKLEETSGISDIRRVPSALKMNIPMLNLTFEES